MTAGAVRLNQLEERYPEFAKLVVGSSPIPFLDTTYVPQGICWITPELVGMAFYDYEKKRPGRLAIVEFATGHVLRFYDLFTESGQPYRGHASGVEVHAGALWLTSKQHLHAFALDDVLRGGGRELLARTGFGVDANASFLSSDGDLLWTGDFTRHKYHPVHGTMGRVYGAPQHHGAGRRGGGWAAAYRVSSSWRPTAMATYMVDGVEVHAPERVVFLPELVQGFAIVGDRVALSRSYGPSDSTLEIYESPFAREATELDLPGGAAVLGYRLDDERRVAELRAPAGIQDLAFDGERLLTTFEGGHRNYRDRWAESGAAIVNRAIGLRVPTLAELNGQSPAVSRA